MTPEPNRGHWPRRTPRETGVVAHDEPLSLPQTMAPRSVRAATFAAILRCRRLRGDATGDTPP
jgi:hypothetical protein